ncbi:MAG TPA: hypothetical protein VGQ83_07195 [Polyangia bacterium]
MAHAKSPPPGFCDGSPAAARAWVARAVRAARTTHGLRGAKLAPGAACECRLGCYQLKAVQLAPLEWRARKARVTLAMRPVVLNYASEARKGKRVIARLDANGFGVVPLRAADAQVVAERIRGESLVVRALGRAHVHCIGTGGESRQQPVRLACARDRASAAAATAPFVELTHDSGRLAVTAFMVAAALLTPELPGWATAREDARIVEYLRLHPDSWVAVRMRRVVAFERFADRVEVTITDRGSDAARLEVVFGPEPDGPQGWQPCYPRSREARPCVRSCARSPSRARSSPPAAATRPRPPAPAAPRPASATRR